MIKNSLMGHCAAWHDMYIEGSNVTYEEFRRLFLEQYWDARKQAEIRNRIMNGSYNPRKDGNTSEYFMKMAQLAKFLDPPIGPLELISIVAGHFPSDLRSAIIVSRPSLLKETMKLLKDLQGNDGPRTNRVQEGVGELNIRESSPRGAIQPFYRDGARSPITSRRNANTNNEAIGNGHGPTEGHRSRWSPNDRYRDRRGNIVNHRVNFIDTNNRPGHDRTPYWIRNCNRRGYWNRRHINQGHSIRMDMENEWSHRAEDRNDRNTRSRSHSPRHQSDVEDPVERLLNNQNARRIGNGEDHRPRTPSELLN